MEILLLEHEKYARLYNCSFYNVSKVPLESRMHTLVGTMFVIAYCFFLPLYCSCIYAMISTPLHQRASYKLMLFLGFIHLVGLQTSGLFYGIFSVSGTVFCTNSLFMYTEGAIAFASWCGSTLTSMILGINRCCELYDGRLAKELFEGWRLYCWMVLPIVYMLFILFFSQPPIYNGIHMAYFFNPHIGYFDDAKAKNYQSIVHFTNNILGCSTESVIYATLITLYIYKATRIRDPELKKKFKREKAIYIQVILIGMIHFIGSFVYCMMQYIPITFAGTLSASILYLMSQGCPGLIYLLVNRTIRKTLLDKILNVRKKIAPSTVATQSTNASGRQIVAN